MHVYRVQYNEKLGSLAVIESTSMEACTEIITDALNFGPFILPSFNKTYPILRINFLLTV